jgi:hypothetical protein
VPLAPAAAAAPALAVRVWGYLPYWSNIDLPTFRWDLISDLLIFSYGLGTDGSVTPPTVSAPVGWNVSGAVAAAHARGVRVHLCITRFGNDSVSVFLSSAAARASAAASLAALAKDLGADGINFDFEFVPSTSKDAFTAFLDEARAALRQRVPAGVVTIAAPPSVGYKGYDFARLAQVTDGLLVMAYGYHFGASANTGPVATLTKGGFWTSAIASDLEGLLAVAPASAIALGVPYYGYDWQAASAAPAAAVLANTDGKALTYREAVGMVAAYGRLWDPPSQTPWLYYAAGGVLHQLWYDDEASLALKYRLAREKKLQGTMIWALGYDRGRTELWNAIRDELGAGPAADGGSADGGGTDGGPVDAGGAADAGGQDPPAVASPGGCGTTSAGLGGAAVGLSVLWLSRRYRPRG